ncbi:MAG: MFS transporter [Anaerolineales bacterium]|nr:MFS transporter [Anaerolineales bacterium]
MAGPNRSVPYLIAAMCLAETLGMMGIFAFPALLPRFFEIWHLTNTQAGWINGIYFAGYTLGVPILVTLTDRLDARRIYLTSTAVGALTALGFALFAQGFWTALLFRALAGLGLAGTYIPGLRALVDRIEGPAQARAISFYTAAFGLGVGFSFFANGQLERWLGWQWAFGLAAMGSLIALILAAWALAPQPPKTETLPLAKLFDFRPVFRNPGAMAYILAYAVHVWEIFTFRSWVVAFLAFSLTLQSRASLIAPTLVAAVSSLAAMWASIGGAELAVRYGKRRVLTLIMGGSALMAAGLGFTATWPYPVLIGLIIIYACFVQGDSATVHAGVVQSAEAGRLGVTMAVQSFLGFTCAFLGPLVFGLVLDVSGFGETPHSWGLAFMATGAVIATGPIILAWLLPKAHPLRDERVEPI